jgi:ABC-type transport system involved in cytochrome bd biosynthesis fused ATPase/permease subunit
MEFAVIVLYAVILGLVAPYIHARSEEYGTLLAPSVALATGAVFWTALTWLGFDYKEGYIWVICMVAMPLAMIIVSSRVAAARVHAREKALRG